MQGLSQPWQSKGAILPQSNLIQVAWIAVSITRVEIIIMWVKEKLHFQIYVISFLFISASASPAESLFSPRINILHQTANLNCSLIYCAGIKNAPLIMLGALTCLLALKTQRAANCHSVWTGRMKLSEPVHKVMWSGKPEGIAAPSSVLQVRGQTDSSRVYKLFKLLKTIRPTALWSQISRIFFPQN